METTQGTHLIDRIPDPEEVRSRLVACTEEAAVLRDLLRVAERAKRERQASHGPTPETTTPKGADRGNT